MAVVLAPIAEEAIFRGVLYPAFRNRGHRWIGLWVTALLFGAIHVNLAAFVPLTFLALVFTWLYERTGNQSPSILYMTLTARAVNHAAGELARRNL